MTKHSSYLLPLSGSRRRRSRWRGTSASTTASFCRRRRTCRSKQRNVVAIVFADKLHDLDDAGTCVCVVGSSRSPLPGGNLRILVNDLVEDAGGAGAGKALDGAKLLARLVN